MLLLSRRVHSGLVNDVFDEALLLERALVAFRFSTATKLPVVVLARLTRSQDVRVVRFYDGCHVGHAAVGKLDGVAVENRVIGVFLRKVSINNAKKLLSDLRLDG